MWQFGSAREANLVLPLMTPQVICLLADLQRTHTPNEFEAVIEKLLRGLKEQK
jgi:hypothetical protein